MGPGRFLIQEEEWRPRGKPDGGCGGGRRRPPGWDLIREAKPRICYWCRSDLPLGKGIHKIQYRVVIDLEKLERKLVGTRTLWRVYWVRCPACGGLVSEGDLVNAPKGHVFGYGITAYAIARQLVT